MIQIIIQINMKDKIKIGDKYNRLLVTSFSHERKTKSNYSKKYYNCLCDCGNIIVVDRCSLRSNKTKSCGCLNYQNHKSIKKNLIGKKFDHLLVINRNLNNYGIMYNCKCSCGKNTTVSYSNLVSGASRRCGNCGYKYIRGAPISFKQLDLYKLLGIGVINFKSGKYSIDIALHIQDKKIAIEYDEIYWHKNYLDRDLRKNKYLISKNWKVLRIKAHNNLPSKEQIFNILDKMLQDSITFYELDISGDKNAI